MKTGCRHLVLGVSGGIAAYKIPHLVRLCTKQHIDVKTVLTDTARSLVGEETLRTLSGNQVFTDGTSPFYDMNHIRLAEWADVMAICPATANTIAKIARGIADNLLTTLALSFRGPLLVAPAMNTAMWQNPLTVENVGLLKKRGVHVLPVAAGPLACGDEGEGRMLSVETIGEYIYHADLPRCFTGKRILIASGATAEPLDPVRILTNRSSGRMGASLAGAALSMGADVTVVTGRHEVALPEGITLRTVITSEEMAEALQEEFGSTDICIMAAAICDFRAGTYSSEKIKRAEGQSTVIECTPNRDIAAGLGRKKQGQFLVCFSLETDGTEDRAKEKMETKQCDMIVYNRVRDSLGGENAKIKLLYPSGGSEEIDQMSKRDCARRILLAVARRIGVYHDAQPA